MSTIEMRPSTTFTPPLSYESYLNNKYFTSLDIFRFLSIVSVLWHHTAKGLDWFPASQRGFLGVDFFFVISGFLIVTLLLRERERTGTISLRKFYMRRTLRIFPIYYLLLGAMAGFFLFVKPRANMAGPFFAILPYQVFYLSNFVRDTTILFFTWSLASEEQFYLFWPPVERWLRGAAVPVLLGVIAVNQAINLGWLDNLLGSRRSELNILQVTFTPICLGVLIAHVLHRRGGFARAAAWLGQPAAPLLLLGALVAACSYPSSDLKGWPRLSIQLIMCLLLTSSVIRDDHWLNRLFSFAVVRRVGIISYGMYLYHEFAAHLARVLLTRWGHGSVGLSPAWFLTTLGLTIVVAELSYRYYETPFLRLKDRLGRGGSTRSIQEAPKATCGIEPEAAVHA